MIIEQLAMECEMYGISHVDMSKVWINQVYIMLRMYKGNVPDLKKILETKPKVLLCSIECLADPEVSYRNIEQDLRST